MAEIAAHKLTPVPAPVPVKSRLGRLRGTTLIVAGILVLYWAVLFYATHTKLPPGFLPGNSDKVIHFLAYSGLGLLLMSLRGIRGPFPWTSVVGRWLVLATYGAFDELTQLLVKRNADVNDWMADVLGAASGLGIVTMVCRYFRQSRNR